MPQSRANTEDTYGANRVLPTKGRGPMMESFYNETIASLNRWDLPCRPIGPEPCGAFGTFTVTGDVTQYCGADLFSEIGRETEVFVMFSNLYAGDDSPDAERRPKGFDIRFYTRDGDWDLMGNNTPVPITRIGLGAGDYGHYTQEQLWRYCAARAGLTHMLTSLMSDNGLPATYCHMDGYGSTIYSTVNNEGERFWVRYQFRTNQGVVNITDEDARLLSMFNPRSHSDDLRAEIESGGRPSWTVYMQVMDARHFLESEYDPFDSSRVWSDPEYPMVEVGVLKLKRNPMPGESYGRPYFEMSNLVPGVGLSPCTIDVGQPRGPAGMIRDPYRMVKSHGNYRRDDYSQAGDLFRSMSESRKQELVENTVRRISGLHPGVIFRHMVHCYRADADYGGRIADALDISVYDVEALSELDEGELLGITRYT